MSSDRTKGRTRKPSRRRTLNELDASFLGKWGKEHAKGLGVSLGGAMTPRMMGKAVATEMDLMGGDLTQMQKQWLVGLMQILIDVLTQNDQATYRRVMSRILNDLNTMGLIPPTQPAPGEAMIRTGAGQLVPESAYRGALRRIITEEQEEQKPGMMQKAGAAVGKVMKTALGKMFGGEQAEDLTPEMKKRNSELAKRMSQELIKTNVIPQGAREAGEAILMTAIDIMSRTDDPQELKMLAPQLGNVAAKIPLLSKKAKAVPGKPNNTPETGPQNKPMNKPNNTPETGPKNKPNNLPR